MALAQPNKDGPERVVEHSPGLTNTIRPMESDRDG